MDEQLLLLINVDGVIDIRNNRHLRGKVARAVDAGHLVRLMPGIYAPDRSWQSRVSALSVWDPDAVLIGETAARLTWWRDLQAGDVRAATRRNARHIGDGYQFQRGRLPEELVMYSNGLRFAHPALSVLQMLPAHGGTAIDEALRLGAVRIGDLQGALKLMPSRDGNARAARLILESRDEPWSTLEREAHALLHDARITGWRANHPVQLGEQLIFIDLAWPALKLAVEIDGWQYHRSFERFVGDRQRDVDLTMLGWTTMRFTDPTMDTLARSVSRVIRRLERA